MLNITKLETQEPNHYVTLTPIFLPCSHNLCSFLSHITHFQDSFSNSFHPIFRFQPDLPWCFYRNWLLNHTLVYLNCPRTLNALNRQVVASHLGSHCSFSMIKNTVSKVDLSKQIPWLHHILSVWRSRYSTYVNLKCLYL